ncbi:MAG: RNA polymerase sigma factor [Flavobacteriales bacterium]
MKVSEDLILRCSRDERKAQFELYRECYGQMMQICLRYQKNRDDAQAILNEAFLKVCDKIGTYKAEVPFEFWMRRITINTCIDNYRKNKAKNEHIDHQDVSENYWASKMTTVNTAETEMNAESLRALINSLPPISQQVFNLCVLDGYEYAEVAEMLSISEATCRWHVHFSRKKLQELIKTTFNISQPVLP